MPGICLPPHFLNDDRVRLLTAHELKGWLAFSLLAARNRREPGVIPAMPPEMRAKKLGMPLKTYEKRLEKLTAPGVELIEQRADGALVIADLWDEDEEWDGGQGDRGPVARSAGATRVARFREKNGGGHGNGTNGNGHSNGVGSNGVGSNGVGSNGVGSNGVGSNGVGSNGVGNAEALQNGSQALQNGSGSVTAGVTGASQKGVESVTNGALHPRGRVGDVSNVSGISNNSLELGDVSNVPASPPVTPPVTPTRGVTPPPPAAPRPLLHPALRVLAPHEVRVAKRVEVDRVMRLVEDDPKWKGLWYGLWNHCQGNDLLHCWDQGQAFLAERLRTSPPTGRGSVGNKGKWLRTVIMVLAANAGHIYLPAGAGEQAGAEPGPPVDEAEAADVRRQVEEIRARWQAEEQGEGEEK